MNKNPTDAKVCRYLFTAIPLQRGLIGTASRSDGFLFTLKERDCLEDKDVDGCKILKRIIKKPNGRQ